MFESDIENQINDLEVGTEQAAKEERETIKSLEEINKIIISLERDSEMLNAMGKLKESRQEKLVEVESRLENFAVQRDKVCKALEEQARNVMEEREKINSLASLGEDVSEANAILSEKWNSICSCSYRLQELAYKLDEKSGSYIINDMAASIGSGLEQGKASLDGLSKGDLLAFRRIIRQGDSGTENPTQKGNIKINKKQFGNMSRGK